MTGSLAMIRSAVDFAALAASGGSRSHPLLVVRYRRNQLERTRYGISTGRRVGSAVVRNRIRRRLRELLRRTDQRVMSGWDILVVARPAAATADQAELGAALEGVLSAAGVMEGTGRT